MIATYAPVLSQVMNIVSWCLIGLGSFFIVVGGIGLVRMPDLYTRMHATSVAETLGACLLLIGLILQTEVGLTMYKLLTLLGLVVFVGPVITHALAQAALHGGIQPALTEDRRDLLDRSSAEGARTDGSNEGRAS